MDSFTVKSYWKAYNELPEEIRQLADKKFAVLVCLEAAKQSPKLPLGQAKHYIIARPGIS